MLISVSPLITTSSAAREVAWPELVAWLAANASNVVPRKDDVVLFTLTDAGGGVHDNEVRAVWGVGLDYDGTTPEQRAQAVAAARGLGAGCFYTTHSHGLKVDQKRPEATERFRIFFPFDRPLEGPELRRWKAVWTTVATAVGRFHPKKAPGTSEANLGRRWYVPATNPAAPAPCAFEAWEGEPLSLDVLLTEARTAPAIAAPAVDELDLDQGEPVGRAELHRLASSLVRRSAEEHQRVGRALRRMINGEGFGANRGTMQWQVAGEIARAYPFADAGHIAEILRLGLEADGPPTDDFADQLRRQQAHKQTEIAEQRAVAEAFAAAAGVTPAAKPGTPAAMGAQAAQVAACIGLRLDDRGKIAATLANTTAILALHPEWVGVIGYNQHAQRTEALREPPMRAQDTPQEAVAGAWTDVHTHRARAWISEHFGFEPSRDVTDAAIETAAHKAAFHPVRDYLRGLTWDGVQRLDQLFPRYFGSPDTPYSRAIGARSLIAAVARALVPGSKVDSMTILEGPQGKRKSTAIRTLAGAEWFADTALDFDSPQALAQALMGKWLYEVGELHGFNRTEITRLKVVISAQVDNIRRSYGRRNEDLPRQCVFWGTTNEQVYLSDTTGNRRFWPVRCGEIDIVALATDRDQLWAEAAARLGARAERPLDPSAGERWWFEAEEAAAASEEQAERETVDTWEAQIAAFIARPYVPPGETTARERDRFVMSDVLGALGIEVRDQSHAASTRAGRILAKLGWRSRVERGAKGVARVYSRDDK
jgi:predicted P-loop ATPase